MSATNNNKLSSTKKYADENEKGNQNGAMLMLAEVAAWTLTADNKTKTPAPSTSAPKRKRSKESKSSKSSGGMPLNQARMLSGNQLVRTFSRFEGDEMKRIFSFQCLLIPRKCKVRFESFGSETKARSLVKDHLLNHLDTLPDGEILQVPKQKEETPYRKVAKEPKTSKKTKPAKQAEPVLKPVETKDLEISEIPMETCTEVVLSEVVPKPEKAVSVPKPTKAPATVAQDPLNIALAECYQELERNQVELVEEGPTTPDHIYYRAQRQQETVTIGSEQYTSVETIWIKSESDSDHVASGITNYVLTDNNQPLFSVSNEVVVKTEEIVEEEVVEEEPTLDEQQVEADEFELMTVKTEDAALQQDSGIEEMDIKIELDASQFDDSWVERDEHRQQKKPKGKAKFIGQSAAEKEMAVRMIESMKLKQGGSEPLECQICVPSRVFTAPTTLISHYRSHAGIKPYECHLCGGVFTRQHSLNYHLLIHSNKTRFTCTDCGRKFRHPSHFKEHQRRHTGEAPFECEDCVIRFKTRNTYKRHLKTRHGKVLTQSGGIIILSEEEFRRVRTAPRSLGSTRGISSDKENNRRPRAKVVNLLKPKKKDDIENEFIQKLNLNGNWSTNLLEPELQIEATEEQMAILHAVEASGATTPVIVLSGDNIIYNGITA